MKSKFFSQNTALHIVFAMLIGTALGTILGDGARSLSEIGKIVIQLIKIVAIPLMFLTIVKSILTSNVKPKDGLRLFFFTTVNASIALAIGMAISAYFQPGAGLAKLTQNEAAANTGIFSSSATSGDTTVQPLGTLSTISALAPSTSLPNVAQFNWLKTLKSFLPSSIVSPFSENAVIPLVLLALVFAAALRSVKTKGDADTSGMENTISVLLSVTEKILFWIIKFIPLAVMAVVAFSVGQYGFAPFKSLAAYVGVALLGMLIQILIVQQAWVYFYAKIPLKRFWEHAREPIVFALGANSSLATLPVTLRALKNLKISNRASSLGACIGTNLNNDGIILYEGMAVLFIAQAHGIQLSVSEQIYAAILCLISAIGVAGIPEAGFVSLSLVLVTVGLPLKLLPLVLTVDWIVARARSGANTVSDMVISILLDHRFKKQIPR